MNDLTIDKADMPQHIRNWVDSCALNHGFDCVGVVNPADMDAEGARLEEFVSLGRHGTMEWMSRRMRERSHPSHLWGEVKSVIVLGTNYGPDENPLPRLRESERAVISVYAEGRDYHDLIKKRLKRVGRELQEKFGGDLKVFVDTAPVMEKPLAEIGGLGWQGKHTNLVSPRFGSWLFLGCIFTTLSIQSDQRHDDQCGTCQACLDICPTNAFPAPYQLDARRCISYLTIEYKGHIPIEFRRAMGNRVYGCDDCLAVCPWNKFAKPTKEISFQSKPALEGIALERLIGISDDTFRQLFSGSPVKRTGRDRFLRNVLIATANSRISELIAPCAQCLNDPSPLVRAMAVWAVLSLCSREQFDALKSSHLPGEEDEVVREEWMRELGYA